MKFLLPLALAIPAIASAQTFPTNTTPDWKSYMQTGNPADIVSSPTVAKAIGAKVNAVDGQSQGMIMQGGSSDGAMSVAGVGSVDRSLSAHFLDHISSADYGTVGNNTTDDGPAFASAVAAAAQSSLQVPHSSAGYLLNTGSFSGGEYPNYSYNWQTDASVYPGVSDIDYGNSYIHGTAAGSPDNCTGNINSPYTQPCLAVTGRRIIMDPASIWAGPNTTNVGLDIECLPNHVSPNSANLSNGYARNWTACMYFGAETGTGGTTNTSGSGFGSSISTELVNWALNVNTNSGIGEEFDINVIGNVLDGGITRGQFMLSSAAFKGADSVLAGHSPWGTAGSWAEGYEVNATPFTTTTKPATQTSGNGETVYTSSTSGSTTTYTVYPRWTRGYSASGAVDDFVGVTNVAGESGNLLRGMDATGANYFALDKLGNVTTNGFVYVKNANFYVSNGRYCLDTACARYIYEAGSRVKIGNTTNGDVFSIDDSGNVIAKGTITPSATP